MNHQRGRKGEKGVSFTGDGLLQRRRRRQGGGTGCEWCCGTGKGRVGEREEAKEVPKLYTGREREKGKWKGEVAGGLP
jgi:hypothetical protein